MTTVASRSLAAADHHTVGEREPSVRLMSSPISSRAVLPLERCPVNTMTYVLPVSGPTPRLASIHNKRTSRQNIIISILMFLVIIISIVVIVIVTNISGVLTFVVTVIIIDDVVIVIIIWSSWLTMYDVLFSDEKLHPRLCVCA